MNTTTTPADFGRLQLDAVATRNRRRAMARLALQYFFGLMMAASLFVIVRSGLQAGMEAALAGWPSLLLLFAGAAVLRLLNKAQHAERRRWQQRALSVREHLDGQLASIDDRRRGSRMLLAYAVLAQLVLLPSCWLLAERGLLAAGQLPMIIGLCLLPSLVIGGVHGYRLRVQLPRERAEAEAMGLQLSGDN